MSSTRVFRSIAYVAVVVCAISVARAAQARSSVAALPLEFVGDVLPADREVLRQRMVLGLKGSAFDVVADERVTKLEKGRKGRCDAACRREQAASLRVRYIAGGKVEGKHGNLVIELWLADGYSGKVLARADQRCDICGITEAASFMDLAASSLHAKLNKLLPNPGVITVTVSPPGADIYVDDDPVGPAPQTLELPAGEHTLSARAVGYTPRSRTVNVIAGVREDLALKLGRDSKSIWRQRAGWISAGVGVAAIITGAALVGIAGNDADCRNGPEFQNLCSKEVSTAAPGWTALGVGAVALTTGLYLLFTQKERPASQPKVTVATSGAGLLMSSQF